MQVAPNEAETAEVAEAAEAAEADAEESFQRDSFTDFSLATLVSLVSYSGRYWSCFGVERVAEHLPDSPTVKLYSI